MSIINDLLPPTVDAIIPQGSDVREFFRLWVDEAKTQPLDLTNLTAYCQVRKSYDTKSALFELTSVDDTILLGARIQGNQVVPDDPANGGICIIYPNVFTSGIRFTGDSIDLVRDVELRDTDGNVRRILQGTITLSRESTRLP